MHEHQMLGRQDVKVCPQCGKTIVFEFWPADDAVRRSAVQVVALDPGTGDRLDDCPGCGMSLRITKGALQRKADDANA